MKIVKNLKSVRLAVGLLLYLTAASALATLIPQGQDAGYYQAHYSKIIATLIVDSHFNRFFSSLLFLLPAFLFFINLSLCTFDRFTREIRKKRGPKRFGPDILHFGLILLTIGSVVSFSERQEGYVDLAVGDKVELPGGSLLELTDFEYLTYSDGRPQDWISRVKVTQGDKVVVDSFDIKVNHPLKIGSIKLYQVSHSAAIQLILEDQQGKPQALSQGDRITRGETSLFFMAPEDKAPEGLRAVIHTVSPAGTSVVRAGVGDTVGDLKVREIQSVDITGLEAVSDPGSFLVFISFIFLTIGLAVTFYQKLRDLKPGVS